MPRRIPETRLADLLAAATRVFVVQGYRRTQMEDVARALGVAKGTLYRYVESKQALFAACLRHADRPAPELVALELPLPTPGAGELLAELRAGLAAGVTPPALAAALARKRVGDVRAELEAIVRELFAGSMHHRTVIELIDRCGADHPELAAAFYAEGRFAQLRLLAEYLESRVRRGRLPALPDPEVAARFVIETIAIWAVHMHWDPAPQKIDPRVAEETVVAMLLGGLLGERTAPRAPRREDP